MWADGRLPPTPRTDQPSCTAGPHGLQQLHFAFFQHAALPASPVTPRKQRVYGELLFRDADDCSVQSTSHIHHLFRDHLWI